ncbi:hypothetical protein [Flagellimonas marinaquae]|uniref:hypothetical protein n=1 Tax=Flagellimonas marinaquae TaxID=254955 RepID=UPI000F8F6A2D|nr:hypothetical protein [Allomuricauda aquimarina]
MRKDKLFGIISVGILFGVLFPLGLHTLMFKILERIFFLTDLDILLSSAIAAYSSVVLAVVLFLKLMNYLINSELNEKRKIKSKMTAGVLANIGLYFFWFLIPFTDNNLGEEYQNKVFKSYELLSTEFVFYEILINQLSSIICFVILVGIMYNKLNTVANNV